MLRDETQREDFEALSVKSLILWGSPNQIVQINTKWKLLAVKHGTETVCDKEKGVYWV